MTSESKYQCDECGFVGTLDEFNYDVDYVDGWKASYCCGGCGETFTPTEVRETGGGR